MKKITKALIFSIPVIIIAYILLANFVLPKTFSYEYNAGSSTILGPSNRVSEPLENGAYRNLTANLVYFDAPIARGAKNLTAEIRFRSNTRTIIGAQDQEIWSYSWKTLYDPIFSELENVKHSGRVYALGNNEILSESELLSKENKIIATNEPVLRKTNKIESFENKPVKITTTLRGGHVFYLYAKDNLKISITKQDINWYNDTDETSLTLKDSSDNIILTKEIPDDGVAEASRKLGPMQTESLELNDMPEGVYRLEISDFDGLIKEISSSTDKIVVSDRIYLADSNLFIKGSQKNSTIYTKATGPSTISFLTWHNEGLQKISINNKSVETKEKEKSVIFETESGEYKITSPKNDIIISTPGYFSFYKEGYFEPFTNRIVKIPSNSEELNRGIDYIITDYSLPIKDGDWMIASISYDLDGLYVKNNKLSMVFNVPNLQEQNETSQISISSIKLNIFKPGAFS